MYAQSVLGGANFGVLMGERITTTNNNVNTKERKQVFLDGTNQSPKGNQVQPLILLPGRKQIPFENNARRGIVYDVLKPMMLLTRFMGISPIGHVRPGVFQTTTGWLAYSVFVCLLVLGYIGYIKWDKIEVVRSAEGRFEEAVIDYLFTVYLIPVVLCPAAWHESRKLSKVFTDWGTFEKIYKRVNGRLLPLHLGNKPLFLTIGLPVLSCSTMVVTHVTMAHFRVWKVVPFCYINTITYLIGGMWYIHCDAIGKIATIIADDFEVALKHIGPSTRIAEYRSMWMLLSRITRDVGNSSCYVLIFLSLYLFLIITLTIYGLLSQIQEGLGIKDIGLTITAVFAIGLLYFVCDEAHYASNCVRVYFQKKLLLVELSWMNEDAQHEITMFLRATEMNSTDMSLGGFFDVNRNLFKSLLATMVTYLVVLLQFQISIPGGPLESDDGAIGSANLTTIGPPLN